MITPHVACLVRRWVDLYTHGLSAAVRDRRRGEIAADLWSQIEESHLTGRGDRATAFEMVIRLVTGLLADVSWRLEKRGQEGAISGTPRVIAGNPATGAVAILGGLVLATAVLVVTLMGPYRPWSDPVAGWIVVTSLTVGALALALACLGLIVRNEDRLRRTGLVGGVAAIIAGFLAAVGVYPVVGLVAAGSAVLTWELGRIDALDRRLALGHVISGLVFFAGAVASVAGANIPGLGVLLLWYPATWVAIGFSVLRGRSLGEPAAHT